MKSSPSIWHLLHNIKSTVKISSIFVDFLENMNFITPVIIFIKLSVVPAVCIVAENNEFKY